jgi:hypothetical protein
MANWQSGYDAVEMARQASRIAQQQGGKGKPPRQRRRIRRFIRGLMGRSSTGQRQGGPGEGDA